MTHTSHTYGRGLIVCLLSLEACATPLIWEAEHAHRLDTPFLIRKDEACSGGLCITVPVGSAEIGRNLPPQAPALYTFRAPDNRKWKLWFRARWTNTCGNSFTYSIDNQQRRVAAGAIFGAWRWVKGSSIQTDKKAIHTLHIWNREDGIAIDQIGLFPSGTPPTRTGNAMPAVITPMKAGRDIPPFDVFFSLPHCASASENPAILLSHNVPKMIRAGLDRRELFLTPRAEARVTFWIRNNRMGAAACRISIDLPPGVHMPPSSEPGALKAIPSRKGRVVFSSTAKENVPLIAVPVTVACDKNLALATHALRLSLIADNATVTKKTLLVTRPLDWMIIGPFPEPNLDKPIPPEKIFLDNLLLNDFFDQSGFYKESSEPARWIRFRPEKWLGANGRVDLLKMLGQRAHVSALAVTQVQAPRDAAYTFDIENDDRLRLWINGLEAHTHTACLPASASRRIAPLRLRKGKNVIVARITQNRERWEFKIMPTADSGVVGLPFEDR